MDLELRWADLNRDGAFADCVFPSGLMIYQVAMFKIIIVNVLLFILFILLFIVLAFAIGYAMGTTNHTKETAATYVALCCLHVYINYRILKKKELNSLKNRTISIIIIVGAYLIYLFVF